MDQSATIERDADAAGDDAPNATEIIDLLLTVLSDGLDHPELWGQFPSLIALLPDLPARIAARASAEWDYGLKTQLTILLIMCVAARGDVALALESIAPAVIEHSQSAQVQGAAFYLQGRADPDNPKYRLAGKLCRAPFIQLDVLERSAHQCCASWLHASAGDLSTTPWQEVWNSDTAQAVRASMHDGSYRYCNKTACPAIQGGDLADAGELAQTSDFWREVVVGQLTALDVGPEVVNLAYDRTCNLSCPSCRTESFAADAQTRARFDEMQQTRILPLLKNAKTVFVTGSGDPFASKNFRRLMTQLTAADYPGLKFQIMTNGMLFTPRQWESFPALHGRVQVLKISIDAATGPTHEALRRGARWPVMLENMAFAGQLTATGLVDHFELVFTVQHDNYREMGAAVDLAKSVGASGIYFARLTNWGTFSHEQYERKAVFLESHPDHADFIAHMQDARLCDPMVLLSDLLPFIHRADAKQRAFAH